MAAAFPRAEAPFIPAASFSSRVDSKNHINYNLRKLFVRFLTTSK